MKFIQVFQFKRSQLVIEVIIKVNWDAVKGFMVAHFTRESVVLLSAQRESASFSSLNED